MSENHFRRFADLGYARLVPIVPPDAKIYEKSTLAKRQDARGKAVGIKRWNDGLWCGFDWIPHEADERDYDRWHAMGAGVGVKTGAGLVAIDADTLIEPCAKIVRDTIEQHFGRLAVRIGRYPKALYLLRTTEDYRYTRIDFGDRDERGNLPNRVEVLSDGRQFVAHGIHPVTGKPYEWPRGLPAYDDVPAVTASALDAFMADLRGKLPKAQELMREGSAASINQEALRGDPVAVKRAVEAMPNTNEHFPTRENYREVGYAIKGALQSDPAQAYELFAEWCARWRDGDNDPDVVASDWNRMKPPFKVGAGRLYDLAEQSSAGKFTVASVWFDDIDEVMADNPFAVIEEKRDEAKKTDVYPTLTVDELINRPPPEWLIARHLPRQSVGFIYAAPGVGKTFLALDAALSIAAGASDWNGDQITATPGSLIIYVAAEGSYGFRNRIKAWMQERGVDHSALNAFRMIEKTINFMHKDDIDRLRRTIQSITTNSNVPLAMIVVDTVSRAIPGADENLQKDMTLFVGACTNVQMEFKCAVVGIHHAGKNGEFRGSTALPAGGDFVFHLDRKKGASLGTLTCVKMKDGPDGWSENYAFSNVDMPDGETSLVVNRVETGIGPSATVTPGAAAEVLRAMAAAWEEGSPWCRSARCKPPERYAVRRMVTDYGFDGEAAERLLQTWEEMGAITHEIRDTTSKRAGFKVAVDPGQFVRRDDIFD